MPQDPKPVLEDLGAARDQAVSKITTQAANIATLAREKQDLLDQQTTQIPDDVAAAIKAIADDLKAHAG